MLSALKPIQPTLRSKGQVMTDARFGLEGKVAAVTGAARGIGRAIAVGLAQAGAQIAIIDLPGMADEVSITMREVQAAGRECRFYPTDITHVADIEPAVERIVADFGGLHVFVNDAGVVSNKPALEIVEAEWDHVLNVNLRGMFFCAVAAARHMRSHGGGRIINITAGAGQRGNRSLATPYLASKGGVIALTRSLALEWIDHGILVNCVGPGNTNTPMVRQTDAAIGRDEEGIHAMIRRRVPLGRRIEPEEVAAAVVFLAGPGASAVVGQNVVVDGGSGIL
jgi:2-deoxy-D-gluconate 3-dehydrogenase